MSERRDTFCDVHYHPWLGGVEDQSGLGDLINPIAVAFARHTNGTNSIYAEGHAKWKQFSAIRASFEGHELYGEFQAF